MIAVPLTDEQYGIMEPLLKQAQEAALDGKPGMLVAQVGTGGIYGQMRVFFLPNDVAFEVQKLMAKRSTGRVVLPGTKIG